MLFDKFIGGISQDDTHSNQYAAGTASDQTFSQRKQVERSRATIGSYQQSAIGNSFAPRGEYVRPARKYARLGQRSPRKEMDVNGNSIQEQSSPRGSLSRQSMNARPQAFKEPPARGYNPYA